MAKSAQLPEWVKNRYDDVFGQAMKGDSPNHNVIIKFVEYSLPPPNYDDVVSAYRIYARDHDIMIDDSVIETIYNSTELDSKSCTTTGSQYPLFFALDRPHLLNRPGKSARNARKLLSEMFSEIIEYTRPGIYIDQLRGVRNLLLTAIENEEIHGIQLNAWHDLHAIYSSPSMRSLLKEKNNIYNVFCELEEGLRLPGKAVREEQVGRTVRKGRKRDKKLSKLQVQRRQTIADAKTAPQIQTSGEQAEKTKRDQNISPNLPHELASMGYSIQSTSSSQISKPEEVEITLVRKVPSQLTPTDDRRTARKIAAMATTDALKSTESAGMLTPWQLHQILKMDLKGPPWVLCRLLLLTGMAVSRLTTLESRSFSNHEAPSLSKKKVYWDRDEGVIYYRLADGPAPSINGDVTNCVIVLKLPIEIQNKLKGIEKEKPLSKSDTLLNSNLKKKFSRNPGITPTSNRVRMTSYLFLRKLSPNKHLVETLSGSYGPLDAAPAAYRAVMRNNLQELFDIASTSLGLSAQDNEVSVAKSLKITDHFGSSRTLPRSISSEWFNALREAFKSVEENVYYRLPTDPFPINDTISALNISSAHSYLAWLLGTGGRPVGNRTRTVISKPHAWINDKNSRKGPESRLVMIPELLYSQLQAHNQLTTQVTRMIKEDGFEIIDKRVYDQQLPSWLSKSKTGAKVIIRTIYHRDWKNLMQDILPHRKALFPDNATRHTETSALNKILNESVVDATIGHVRIGRDKTRPKSLATMLDQKESRKWQEKIMHMMGFTLMEGDDATWKS